MKNLSIFSLGLLLGWALYTIFGPIGPAALRLPLSLPQGTPEQVRDILPTTDAVVSSKRAAAKQSTSPLQRLTAAITTAGPEAVVEVYRQHCKSDSDTAERCRKRLLQLAAQRAQQLPLETERLLEAWLRKQPNDPQAMWQLALVKLGNGNTRRSLILLHDLRLRPQQMVEEAMIEQKIAEIVTVHLAQLHQHEEEGKALDFTRFLVDIDNGNLGWRYLLGRQYMRTGSPIEAMSTLDQIIYDPNWGSQALSLMAEIKQSFAPSEPPPQPAEADVVPQPPPQRLGLRVPLQRHNRHFVVNCEVGRHRKLSLLIDTGASLTAIREVVVRSLDLGDGIVGHISLNTANGNITAPLTVVKSFSVAGQTVRDMEVAVMSLGNLDDTDGLLGMNYLRHFDFYIDQNEPALYLSWRDR